MATEANEVTVPSISMAAGVAVQPDSPIAVTMAQLGVPAPAEGNTQRITHGSFDASVNGKAALHWMSWHDLLEGIFVLGDKVWGCPVVGGSTYRVNFHVRTDDSDGGYVSSVQYPLDIHVTGAYAAGSADRQQHHTHPHGHDWGLHTHPEPSSIGGNQAAIAALERRVAALEAAAVSGSGSGREGA